MEYHKHISSKNKLFDLKLGEVWRYRGLAWLFTKREFKVAYKQTILGPAWLFIRPIMTALIHMLVFNTIANLTTMGVPKFAFQVTSTAIWTFFSSCISDGSGTFLSNSGLFGKVYFPRLIKPISYIMSGLIRFGIQMLLVIALLCYYVPTGQISPNYLAWLLIPPVLIGLGIMGMGFGLIVSSVTTKYRDLSILVSFGVQLWMYGSPIVYPLDQLGGILRTILVINPVTAPVEILRYAILGQGVIEPLSVVTFICAIVIFGALGAVLFNRTEKNFIDII